MKLDLRTPEEYRYDQINRRGERHQLHWVIQDGTITPRLTCLHANLPEGRSCAAQTISEYPELLAPGYEGHGDEARDGIIISRWRHAPCLRGCPEDDGPEFLWDYEDSDARRPGPTQRHTLRFVIGSEDPIEPVFECLHPAGNQCDADVWREDLWLFPELYAGPAAAAARAGTIVSWWAGGQPNSTDLPHWAYAEHATTAILTTTPTNTQK